MGYARKLWHSGLIYEQTCDQCKTVVRYRDNLLGYRPWFADGFVYCPTCKKPLRHREAYAINPPTQGPTVDFTQQAPQYQAPQYQPPHPKASFCPCCGHPFQPADAFCENCGQKRN